MMTIDERDRVNGRLVDVSADERQQRLHHSQRGELSGHIERVILGDRAVPSRKIHR
jgi:hypothetical protein